MPPLPRVDSAVVLYDVNVAEEFRDTAKRCLQDIYNVRSIKCNKDVIKLMLLNTSATRFHAGVSDKTNFVSAKPAIPTSALQNVQAGTCRLFDAIKLALQHIQNFNERIPIKFSQLILITDFSNFEETDVPSFEGFIKQMKELNTYFYVFVPNMMPKQNMKTYDDIVKWAKYSEENRVGMEKSEYLNKLTFRQVTEFIDLLDNGIICDAVLGVHLVNYYKGYTRPQPFTLPISVKPLDCEIPVISFRCLRKTGNLPIKNFTDRREWVYVNVNDPEETVPFENVVTGYSMHNVTIVLTEDLKSALFKTKEPREFTLVGFTDKDRIPDSYMGGDGTSCVVPRSDDANKVVGQLIEAMEEMGKYAIVKRRYIQNTKGKYFVLIPRTDLNAFLMAELPFAQQIIATYEEGDVTKVPEIADNPLQDPLYEYLDKLDVTRPNSDGSSKMPLSMAMMFNPFHLRNARMVENKCLGKELDVEEEWLDMQVPFPDALKELWPIAPASSELQSPSTSTTTK